MKKLLTSLFFIQFLWTVETNAQAIQLYVVPDATPYDVPDLLFGTNTTNFMKNHLLTEEDMANFKTESQRLPFTSFYYPGGSISRLFYYDASLPGYGVNYCEEDDLTDCDLTDSCDSEEGDCNKYQDDIVYAENCDDPGIDCTIKPFFHNQIEFTDADDDDDREAGVTLTLNMYFDREHTDLQNMLQKCMDDSVKINAIILGTELQNDEYFMKYDEIFCEGAANENECYVEVTNEVISWIEENISDYDWDPLDSYDLLDIPIVYDAANNNGWNQKIENEVGVNAAIKRGAMNWWWYPTPNDLDNDNIIDDSEAIADMKDFFTSTTDPKAYPYLIQYFDNYYTQMYVDQYGIKGDNNNDYNDTSTCADCLPYDYAQTLLNQIYTLKRMFAMIQNNYAHTYGDTTFNFEGAYFYSMAADAYDPIVWVDSTSTYALTTTGMAMEQMKYLVTSSYQTTNTTAYPSGATVSDVESFYFNTPYGNSPWAIFVINYSGTTKRLRKINLNGNLTSNLKLDITWATSIQDSILTIQTISQTYASSYDMVLKPYSISIISPNGYFKEDESTAQLPGNSAGSFTMIPNPAAGITHLQLEGFDEQINITVYALDGKTMFTAQASSDAYDLDISHLSNGMYMVKIDDGKRSVAKKLIIEK